MVTLYSTVDRTGQDRAGQGRVGEGRKGKESTGQAGTDPRQHGRCGSAFLYRYVTTADSFGRASWSGVSHGRPGEVKFFSQSVGME